uniref:2-C-methyl-D-erythritol 4-phosphate cytidylyltransferase n=1 Tax=Tetraselmis sp. GSL018 TaxID=582737 RepID=A0A061REI2_9CHLO|mmetsp:Transcript_4946/g.12048  ORF Transcript_4946/g.12048 Transcript_4946/m.12048 type:complete len:339 (+) Transcript_4946:188-1204(+)|eukprot:CAMPEP_0177581398 /NCGR_PEP_ID=MMETSP0419_2-20121207/2125_1 /TAXON_ID=582737 /ORGANISM="Tetraselmis sp., Strain GSL018" /LENGTH=338 /DNA_ID=CAMNT_0019070435 /DNA_START=142 /DNA_END=1158 /DNA_ORIENTATION=+
MKLSALKSSSISPQYKCRSIPQFRTHETFACKRFPRSSFLSPATTTKKLRNGLGDNLRHKGTAWRRIDLQGRPVAFEFYEHDAGPPQRNDQLVKVDDGSVSVILMSHSSKKRAGSKIPNQYLQLRGQPMARWSFATLLAMREVGEVIVVCDLDWRHVFEEGFENTSQNGNLPFLGKRVKFVEAGQDRQSSLIAGFREVSEEIALVAIHEVERPLVTQDECSRCFLDGISFGASVLGVPVKPTIKQVKNYGFVVRTLERSALMEVQSPQAISPTTLREVLDIIVRHNISGTDEMSIVEALGKPVKVSQGEYTNLEVTSRDELAIAEQILEERARPEVYA